MSKTNQLALQNQSSDIYESFSSNQNIENPLQQHLNDHSQQYRLQDVVFPTKPKHYDHLIHIYNQNRNIIKRLAKEVHDLQSIKIKKLRLWKNEKTEDDFAFHEIINADVSKIGYYKQRRAVREKDLKDLKQLYNKLNQINQKQAYLLNGNHMSKVMKIVAQHKQVINYKIMKNHLTVFSKNFQSKEEDQCINNLKSFEQSSISLQKLVDQFYTVDIFKLENLIHWMMPKDVNFQLQEKKSIQELTACKQQAEKDIIIFKSTIIRSSEFLSFLNYSEQLGLIFLRNNEMAVLIQGSDGSMRKKIKFDKCQQILALQIIKNNMYIGSKEGVIRIYTLSTDQQISLTRISRCCINTSDQIDKMVFEQSQTDVIVLFKLKDKFFEYSLNCLETIQRESYDQASAKVDNAALKAYLKTTFIQLRETQAHKINKFLNQRCLQQQHFDLLHIQNDENRMKQNYSRLIIGDKRGNLFAIFI